MAVGGCSRFVVVSNPALFSPSLNPRSQTPASTTGRSKPTFRSGDSRNHEPCTTRFDISTLMILDACICCTSWNVGRRRYVVEQSTTRPHLSPSLGLGTGDRGGEYSGGSWFLSGWDAHGGQASYNTRSTFEVATPRTYPEGAETKSRRCVRLSVVSYVRSHLLTREGRFSLFLQ